MGLTLTVSQVDACQEIAQNTVLEGAITTLGTDASNTHREAALHIDFALSNATAHTGTKIRVQVSSNTSGDEDWTDLYEFVTITGTTNLEVITNNPLAAGGTSITVASTTGYATGAWIFLEDVSTFANSEWCFVTVVTTNTSLTLLDGVTRQHAVNSICNSVAANYIFTLPLWAARVRVVYDNTYDSDGATVAIRCRLSKIVSAA